MSFTSNMERLQAIIGEFGDGGLDMETSLERFEEGVGLIRDCREFLSNAKRKVTALAADGVTEEPVKGALAE
jgi:exodeoxyribonuclease VII small subunit